MLTYYTLRNYTTYNTYRSFATTVSQLKICDFSGENFKGFEGLQFSMSATTAQLLSNGEFYRLHYDTTPVNPLAYTDVPETAGLARSINP